jgi:hypothetical protein
MADEKKQPPKDAPPNLSPGSKIPYQVVASLDGAPLSLPSGATVVLTLQDNASAMTVPDAIPLPGSIASGFIVNQATPPPATVQNSLIGGVTGATNPDGSPVDPSAPAPFTVGPGSVPTSKILLTVTLGTPVPDAKK